LISDLLWWIDLTSKEAFNLLETFALSSAAIAAPLFTAIVLAAVGHALRLFVIYAATQASDE
jgi:hypothetical protein